MTLVGAAGIEPATLQLRSQAWSVAQNYRTLLYAHNAMSFSASELCQGTRVCYRFSRVISTVPSTIRPARVHPCKTSNLAMLNSEISVLDLLDLPIQNARPAEFLSGLISPFLN